MNCPSPTHIQGNHHIVNSAD